ncbi:Ycf66 family protein [Chamaesiphon sp.]|uniref:Ycf66 family protein n=1 Tax=Chamaesiphon sp. TaxID=2814140 RepID=UPI0035934368
MLAHILAVLVGMGSVGLYLAAFFLPDIHRKSDFIWSGVGLFYALTLWIYARQEIGGLLVGQIASVALLGWLGWQTFILRRQLVPVSQQKPIPSTTKPPARSGLDRSTAKPPQPTAKTAPPAISAPPVVTTPAPRRSVPQPPAPTPSVQVPPSQKTVPVESNLPVNTQPAPQPPSPKNDAVEPTLRADIVETTEKAWIELKVKSAPAPKPLGTAAKPPTPASSTISSPPPQPLLPSSTEDRSTISPAEPIAATTRSAVEDSE